MILFDPRRQQISQLGIHYRLPSKPHISMCLTRPLGGRKCSIKIAHALVEDIFFFFDTMIGLLPIVPEQTAYIKSSRVQYIVYI